MIAQPSQRSPAGIRALSIALVLAVSWLVYLNALSNGFTNWDDPEVILQNPNIRSLDGEHLRRILTPEERGASGIPGVYRPLWTLSYALDYRLAGLNPALFHFHSVLLHSINSVLVYILALAVGLASLPALSAALLFAVHPVHVEAVVWASGRNELLLTFFFLIAYLLAAFRARLAGRLRPGAYALSLIALGLALLSKVTAAVFPLVLFATYAWFPGKDGKAPGCRTACLLRHVPYLILSAALVWIELFVSRAGVVVRPEDSQSRAVTLLTVPKVVLSYIGSLVLPLGLAPRYDTAYVTGVSAEAAGTLLGLVLVIALCVWIGRRSPVFGLAALWFGLTLLPASNVVLLSTLRADRFLYLPSVGFVLAVGALLARAAKAGRSFATAATVIVAALGLLYAGLTVGQNRIWKDSLTLWETTASRSPGDYMAQHNLGTAYFEAGRPREARLALERSLALNPNFSKTLNNLGRVSAAAGENDLAERYFRRAVELDPAYANAYASLGTLYAQEGRYEEALRTLARAIELDPTRGEPHVVLGQVYLRIGNPARAREELRRALALGLSPQSRQRAEALLKSSD